MKKYAVIVAGGSGLRMGSSTPKQFLQLRGKPLLWYTVRAFREAFPDIFVILVLPAAFCENQELIETICGEVSPGGIIVVQGGNSRFHSVKNGLAHCDKPSVVFVHDGVRCLVSTALIRRCYDQALSLGSAIPAVAATDSVRLTQGDHHSPVDRNLVRLVQTPQTFLIETLLDAFQQPYQNAFTDEATVVEASGATTHLTEGEYSNIKITRPVDLIIAEQILLEREGL